MDSGNGATALSSFLSQHCTYINRFNPFSWLISLKFTQGHVVAESLSSGLMSVHRITGPKDYQISSLGNWGMRKSDREGNPKVHENQNVVSFSEESHHKIYIRPLDI